MARWKHGARDRLEQAALDLYQEHGYDQTTVAEIAARAGLTERTFFRHFSDKREVLFGGSAQFQAMIVNTAAAAPAHLTPLGAALSGFEAVGEHFSVPEHPRQRAAIIGANPALQDRELSKLAAVTSALQVVLRGRGVPGPAARLAAETAMIVFRTAFEGLIDEANQLDWGQLMTKATDDLRAVVAE